MSVPSRIKIASLVALSGLVLLASSADAAETAKVGKVRLASPRPTGQSVLLVPITYPLQDSSASADVVVTVRGPGLKKGLDGRLNRTHHLRAGLLRSPDLRKSFTHIHAIGLPKDFTPWLKRHGSTVRLTIKVQSYGTLGGATITRSKGIRRQIGVKLAAPDFCSTPSHSPYSSGPGIHDLVTLPNCGARYKWSVSDQPDRGSVSLNGNLADYVPATGKSGVDQYTVTGKGGKKRVSFTIESRTGNARTDSTSVIAMGDSVTAGFGYFGSTGKAMILGQLDECKPGATVYNDSCSSNSSNKTNVGSDLNFLPDYGLSRNLAWPAEWANSYGITDYKNMAVSGSAPSDWLPGGQFNAMLGQIEAEDPDYIMMTLGANPLLSDMLFGIDNMGCAIYADIYGDYKSCIETQFAGVNLAGRLNALYTDLVNKTDSRIVLMHYPLTVPSTALAYSATQIEEMGELLNQVITQQAALVSTSRITVVSPPRFNVGIDMTPLYPADYSCSFLGNKVDGQSVQSNPTQDELEILHPLSFCSGPAFGAPWVISGDTGIHPSFVGHAQMSSAIPPPS